MAGVEGVACDHCAGTATSGTAPGRAVSEAQPAKASAVTSTLQRKRRAVGRRVMGLINASVLLILVSEPSVARLRRPRQAM
ncbi:MAG: hypothetical protein Tsb007_16460 [Rhizobacter sp.]